MLLIFTKNVFRASVPEAVREVLAANNVFMQALKMGIANYTALAQKIKPDVERITGAPVNVNTIVVAIKRFADTLEEEKPAAFRGARMSLTGNILDVDFGREFEEIADFVERALAQSRYSMFQTEQHLRLFAEDVDEIRSTVLAASKKYEGRVRTGLSKITIALPDGVPPYSLLSTVSSILYNGQISIQDAFFTPDEIVLILNEKDAARAYELLRSKIR